VSRSYVKLFPFDQFSSQPEKDHHRDHEPADKRDDGEKIIDEQSQDESGGATRGWPQTNEDRFTDSADRVDSRPIEQDKKPEQENQGQRYCQDGREQQRADDRQYDSGDKS
jgi:hypothetical protein